MGFLLDVHEPSEKVAERQKEEKSFQTIFKINVDNINIARKNHFQSLIRCS